MSETPHIEKPVSPEPSEKEQIKYFGRFGMHLREHFKILDDPDLNVGIKARKEGWFIANHSLVESALVLKIAELLKLDEQQRKILLDAAMTHHAYKRIQYPEPKINKGFTASREEANFTLQVHGIPDVVSEINMVTDPLFFESVNDGRINLNDERQVRLFQKIVAFTHEAVVTNAKQKGSSDITWKQHLESARARHQDLGNAYFDLEGRIIEDIANDLKNRLKEKNNNITDDTPLALQLRKLIMEDIKSDTLPQL